MLYGFNNNKFYLDIPACTRPVGNMREESDRYARDLAAKSNKLLLSISSGLDSQSVLHSFVTQGIPVETAFLYMPGFNDNEYQHLKVIDKKYGITTQIVDIDPMPIINELIEEDITTGIHRLFMMQKKFVSCLPDSADIIQIIHDPSIVVIDGVPHYSVNLHSTEIEKDRAFNLLNRSGKHFFFGDDSEFRYSIYNDAVFRNVVKTLNYTNNNGIKKRLFSISDGDRWDFYIKPFIYGQYWKDELEYFPKFTGHENLPQLQRPFRTDLHVVNIPYHALLEHLGSMSGITNRYYE
jgi:hypothetical protein